MGGSYDLVVVGTDGSATSMAAVERAGSVAADSGATVLIVCAYRPAGQATVDAASDALGADAAHHVVGSSPAEEALRTARERAVKAGASTVDTLAVEGHPVTLLPEIVETRNADLLVVGNRGLNAFGSRVLGSVPSEAARRCPVDVLIAYTTA